MTRLHTMSLVKQGRDVATFTAGVDLDAVPPDPKLRQLLVDAVARAGGRIHEIGQYELHLYDQTGRVLYRFVDTKDG